MRKGGKIAKPWRKTELAFVQIKRKEELFLCYVKI